MIIYPYRYFYTKAHPALPPPPRPLTLTNHRQHLFQLIPPVLITLGSLMIANVAWPLINYQLFTAESRQKTAFVSPVPLDQLGNEPYINAQAQIPRPSSSPQVLGADIDYTDARNWFPGSAYTPPQNLPGSYSLDIPAVNIETARVVVNGEDLGSGLIHYPNTALPGDFGAPIIIGHSVLRQFYNPAKDNPHRYISIFSKIMTLKTGDRIYISYNTKRYVYEVKDKYEVQPEAIEVLAQKLDDRRLKLITCVPEGTYLRRGVVEAQLIEVTDPKKTNVLKETGL